MVGCTTEAGDGQLSWVGQLPGVGMVSFVMGLVSFGAGTADVEGATKRQEQAELTAWASPSQFSR